MRSFKKLATLSIALSFASTFLTYSRADTIPFSGTRHEEQPAAPLGGECGATIPTLIANPSLGIEIGSSNLGAFAADEVACLHTPFPAEITDGVFTFNFVDGDTLTGLFDGYATRVTTAAGRLLTIHQSYLVTGGTGLFAGVTGGFEELGTGVSTGTFAVTDYTFSGELTGPLLTSTPEPQTLALVGSGLLAAAFKARRAARNRSGRLKAAEG